ncbi:tetraacyldisaccharide 4'-kinase [Parvularcula lutaonensis]|uniref:Tetraacyldisaccharide 4'-kinase n=1 Tax=Parvularcula lutaonensis TaxID=491923 RepID=A0ABV7MDI0_9PROT|nr:tetraacyldisaccharide 4'-kinase [Parvularcula lutaonensis]GGY39884.1 tetraacyldisaccharide 4'-kinase [Parvularcula lutaonensis]
MPLDAPRFWQRDQRNAFLARALSPVGEIYHQIVQRRLSKPGAEPPCPVICVGNATVGGVGKTPFVRMLTKSLRERGHEAHVLTRGYGGKEKGTRRVTEDDAAALVGDEPLMLAQDLPVWVSADRPAGAEAAARDGATLIVMDDGFQNPSLKKTLSLMLVDGDTLFGNGRVFPAGPLREKPEAAAARADAIVAVLPGPEAETPPELARLAGGKPLFRAWFAIDRTSIPEGPILAFCGIGRPERFSRSLEEAAAKPIKFLTFPDHHSFTEGEIAALRVEATAAGAQLVTTEKDYIRLEPAARDGITAIRGATQVDDRDRLLRLVEDRR